MSSTLQARPSVNKPLVLELMKGEYLDRRENVLFVGPSGTGKVAPGHRVWGWPPALKDAKSGSSA